jgi:hypothetical protein
VSSFFAALSLVGDGGKKKGKEKKNEKLTWLTTV